MKTHFLIPWLANSNKALPPLNVSIEITHRCNLRCSMCFQSKSTDKSLEMKTEEVKNIIDRLPLWTIITFTGGEPFMRRDFRNILSYALKKRKCSILTNAELINEKDIEMLVNEKLSLIGISIDGIGATHDNIRNKAKLFEKTIETIRKLSKAKKRKNTNFPLIDIKTVILKENLHQLHDIYLLAENLGADFFTLSLPKLSDRQFNEPYYDSLTEIFSHKISPLKPLEKQEIKPLSKQIDLIMSSSGSTLKRFYPYEMFNNKAIKKYYDNEISPIDFKPCSVPWSLACISPYGDVFPCLSYNAGNIKNKTLSEIWNGEKFQKFRAKLNKRHLDNCCLGCCYSAYKRRI